jgi:hypothetical protein
MLEAHMRQQPSVDVATPAPTATDVEPSPAANPISVRAILEFLHDALPLPDRRSGRDRRRARRGGDNPFNRW